MKPANEPQTMGHEPMTNESNNKPKFYISGVTYNVLRHHAGPIINSKSNKNDDIFIWKRDERFSYAIKNGYCSDIGDIVHLSRNPMHSGQPPWEGPIVSEHEDVTPYYGA